MKAQMKFQKYLCLALLIIGALAFAYGLVYSTGSLAMLGRNLDPITGKSFFKAASGKNDATLYNDIKGFNDALTICGIVMILFAVLLYITACNTRRNYYISNYVATGIAAGGNIIISVILMILNGVWEGKFKNVDFASWKKYWDDEQEFASMAGQEIEVLYSDSTVWFNIGYIVYGIVIAASILLILNLVWKIKLMNGEKKLLSGENVVGGAAV